MSTSSIHISSIASQIAASHLNLIEIEAFETLKLNMFIKTCG